MTFDPQRLAVLYYFGELDYWRMPQIAADALEAGLDGNSLRRLAGLIDPVASDITQAQVDAAFREMGVDAPIPRETAMRTLAVEAAQQALDGKMRVVDAATHIGIYLCGYKEPSEPLLRRICLLSREIRAAPRSDWGPLETELSEAMRALVKPSK
jgi:hypothetical protein